ncbi:MAG TPA: hypothetical protein VKB12_08060 [Pyrinomonadaceae bacterium]|nr:hypothetical protein [Pyrinomonadaceae bacterium]
MATKANASTDSLDKLAAAIEKLVSSERLTAAQEFGDTYPSVAVASGPPLSSGSASSAPSQLQQLVTQAIQGVLGRTFKPGDHRSFRAALEVSFEYKEVSGRPSYEWRPRAYPSVGASDIGGGVSGAQYSLVSFATSLHEKAGPLIDSLHSLDSNVDEEEFDAAAAIFETAWDEFVGELSREGGPRASRADALAESIFDPATPTQGHLYHLGEQLGMISDVASNTSASTLTGQFEFDRSGVVTSEEEGYLTSFITLTDYYFAVVRAWENYRDTFLGKDLGSGLLLIERALAVVEDGVNEVYSAMDSVNVDQSERLVIPIGFAAPDNGLTIEDFLSWIASFASGEAPELIREGGKRGVAAIIPTAEKLSILLKNFVGLIRAPAAGSLLPSQFRHARIVNPLDELGRYLQALVQQARSIIL